MLPHLCSVKSLIRRHKQYNIMAAALTKQKRSVVKTLHIAEPPALKAGIALDVIHPLRKSHVKPEKKAKKIALPTTEGYCFETIKHISFLEASGNYTLIHFADHRKLLVCKPLGDIEKQLQDYPFVRIHRSHTIHLRYLNQYIRGKGGAVILSNGVHLPVSAGQKDDFLGRIQQYFS
jgi:DNA-binding LytR/AlgR family response regulator